VECDALTPGASLNQLRIAALPGVPPELVGCLGIDLLPHDVEGAELGRRLAWLIATLTDRATAAEQATTPDRREFLAYWQEVREVTLGGGRCANGGEPLVRATRETLAELRPEGPSVRLARDPAWLPLIGAARSLGGHNDGVAAVLDCGHSAIKRGIAYVEGGALARIETLPKLSSGSREDALQLVVVAAEQTVAVARSTGRPLSPTVVVSVAAYLDDGVPVIDGRSIYEGFGKPGVAPVGLAFVHDGTAAWRAEDHGSHPTAVVVLGTSLGVGLGPQRAPLLPVAPGFVVIDPVVLA
jgi:hypothetical protein